MLQSYNRRENTISHIGCFQNRVLFHLFVALSLKFDRELLQSISEKNYMGLELAELARH